MDEVPEFTVPVDGMPIAPVVPVLPGLCWVVVLALVLTLPSVLTPGG
jgi:hypothetical protein